MGRTITVYSILLPYHVSIASGKKRFLISKRSLKIFIKSGSHTYSEIGRREGKVAGDKICQLYKPMKVDTLFYPLPIEKCSLCHLALNLSEF